MNNQFNSKFNFGQKISEGIYEDITLAFNLLEKGNFDKAFNKFMTIKGKIPEKKIRGTAKKKFDKLEEFYFEAHKSKKINFMYRVIVRYHVILINELDNNNMYLPSLKDTSNFV